MAKSTFRHQVEYQFRGQTRYGIVLSDKAKKGHIFIADAVLPFRVEVPDDTTVKDIPSSLASKTDFPEYDPHTGLLVKGGNAFDKFVSQAFADAQAANRAAGNGVKVGKMFDVGVADGRAHYVVTKIRGSKVTVEWRGFCADRYTDHMLGFGKVISMTDAKRLIGMEDAYNNFWQRMADEDTAFLASLPVGSFVHAQGCRNCFTRFQVVEQDGKKAYKPVGLVGNDWSKHDLPFRYANGVEYRPAAAQMIDKGELRDSLQVSTLWESPKFERVRGKDQHAWTIPDPTGLPLINLTLPPMSEEETEAVRLYNLNTAIVAALKENGFDCYSTKDNRKRLADAYKLLRAELSNWTVAQFKAEGLVDDKLS